ncbi:MAG: ATP-binding cassette domain-containing protein [Bifidobacteriaceae bacterium]|jgi:ABC-2 type transport system ATP-binding protein|nr:ATP-binding cassette domain-containing protein [Bifidobacteriaceae bacterium]
MINIKNLTKSYGNKTVVNNLSFDVPDGLVTGFVGPNGAGKTTTLRCLLSLIKPDRGTVSINGKNYEQLENPLKVVGTLIDAKAYHKSRSLYNHLKWVAASAGFTNKRVDEVIELTGLQSVRNKNVGTFSLGMAQRVNIAIAMMGQPTHLILDEPVNGLDPEGIAWVRQTCRNYAKKGRAVLISSHLLSELENTVDRAVVVGKGQKLAEGTLDQIMKDTGEISLEKAYFNLTKTAVEFHASFPSAEGSYE